jgi:hypothetical protein
VDLARSLQNPLKILSKKLTEKHGTIELGKLEQKGLKVSKNWGSEKINRFLKMQFILNSSVGFRCTILERKLLRVNMEIEHRSNIFEHFNLIDIAKSRLK